MHSKITNIDPATAEQWLTTRPANSRLNKSVIANYRALFVSGRWEPTHQGPVFDRNSALISGAELLAAISESGLTVPVKVTRGEDPANIDFYGRGRPRNSRDILQVVCRSTAAGAEAPLLNAVIMYGMNEKIQNPVVVEQAHAVFSEAIAEVIQRKASLDDAPYWRSGTKAAVAVALVGRGHKTQVRSFLDELLDRREASRKVLHFRRTLNEEYHKISPREFFERTLCAIGAYCEIPNADNAQQVCAYFFGLADMPQAASLVAEGAQ